MKYRKIKLDELKKIELNLLVQFASICEKENFRYSLGGGTLLGAVRHKGFIPWDDDIDVMMPRPDYDRFVCYCKSNKTPFNFAFHELDDTYISLFGKIYAKNTVIYDDLKSSTSRGINIDVFPLDGLANTYDEAIKQFNKTMLYRELMVAKMWNKFSLSKTHPWYYEPFRFILYVMSRFLNSVNILNKIDDINRSVNFDDSKYAACVCGSYRKKEIVKTADLSEYVDAPFEEYYFKILKNYDVYLKNHYGNNYMKLPPENQRCSRHGLKAYVKDNFKENTSNV